MATMNKPVSVKIPPLSTVHEIKIYRPNTNSSSTNPSSTNPKSKLIINNVRGLIQSLKMKPNHQRPIHYPIQRPIRNIHYLLNNKSPLKYSHKSSELETLYPIGTVYSTISVKKPEELFNFGTWEEIEFSPNKQIKSYQRIA